MKLIYIFFFFIFLVYFLNFRHKFRNLHLFNLFFSLVIIFFFFVDIFISARKYRIAPSTVDGRVYFYSRISYVGIRFFFQVNLSILRHFSSLFPFI